MSKLIYEGSVKNLWDAGRDRLAFEYTDAFSVFDWGRMPDELSHKGESLAALGAHFFKVLSDRKSWAEVSKSRWLSPVKELVAEELKTLQREGLAHHFIERSGPNRLLVKRVEVAAPAEHKFAGQTLYHYSKNGKWDVPSRLIPLEVVFRFGMPQGSSLAERLTDDYARQLGFEKPPAPGQLFDRPIIEFFSKFEDTDRFFTFEQALNYSGLAFETFAQLVARTYCLAIWLHEQFAAKGLELWDGKFEWALIEGRLSLVDSIGPDELRLLDPRTGAQISKEFLRLFYRRTDWFEATKLAKKAAAADPRLDWKAEVLKRSGPPPALNKPFREAADALYPTLALALTGENPGGLGLALPELLKRINGCLSSL